MADMTWENFTFNREIHLQKRKILVIKVLRHPNKVQGQIPAESGSSLVGQPQLYVEPSKGVQFEAFWRGLRRIVHSK